MHTNWCILIEISMEIGMFKFLIAIIGHCTDQRKLLYRGLPTCMIDDIPPMEMSFMDNPFACLLALASFVCFILELALLCFSQLCCSGFADWMHAADHHTLSRQLKETIQCQSNPLRIHFSLPLFFSSNFFLFLLPL